MKLYTYYHSSAAYRVRIALNLKGISYQSVAVSLMDAKQKGKAYLATNPQGLIPALELDDGTVIAQSTAIIEYLEETDSHYTLLPSTPLERSQVRSMVSNIACDIHPLNNLRVLHYLRDDLGADQTQVHQWYAQWINSGFHSIEKMLAQGDGKFCFGNKPGIADCT